MKQKLAAVERPDRALDRRMRRERDPRKRLGLKASMHIVQKKQRPHGVEFIERHLDVMGGAYTAPDPRWFAEYRAGGVALMAA